MEVKPRPKHKIIVHLGPRIIYIGKEAVGTIDDISIEVDEATPEELEKLIRAPELRLIIPGLEGVSNDH